MLNSSAKAAALSGPTPEAYTIGSWVVLIVVKVSIFWAPKMQNQSTNIYRLATLLLDGLLLMALFIAVAFWRFEDLRISNPEYYNYYLQL